MRGSKRCILGLIALLVTVPAAFTLCPAEDEAELGWSDTAELGYVVTSGNSKSSTLGFKNTLRRRWENALFTLNAGGIHVETEFVTREAFASDPNDATSPVSVDEDRDTRTTAENYYLNGRYRHLVTGRFYWYGGAGWDRNRFAGIENRYVGSGGVGNTWYDREDLKFTTEYGITYTDQEDVVENPDMNDTFLGAQFSWNYLNKFGANTTYTNTLVVDENLDETSDWRGDMINSVAVAMSERLALKVSLQWLYDNEPSFEAVEVVNDNTGRPPVLVELDELDTIFTASLVVNM